MQNQNARLYVGGIQNTTPNEKLEEIFGKYGKIIEIKRNRNFSFIQFADENMAQAAISSEHGKNYFGKSLDVQIAKQSNRDGMGPGSDKEGGPVGPGGHRGGPPFPGGPFGGSFDDKRDQGFRDGSPGFRGGRMGGPPDERFDMPYGGPGGGPGFDRHHGPGGPPPPPVGFDHGPGFNGPPGGGPRGGSYGPPRGPRPFDDGFRDGPNFSGPPRFGGGGNFRGNMMEAPPNEPHPPTQPPGPLTIPHENRTNDVEIIVINKAITEYGEFIEQKLKSLAFTVDLLFPNEEVPLRRVLANIASRGTLYAVLVTPQHREKRSLSLNILHGAPQEHRNMLVDDAVTLISRNYEMYVMQTAEKKRDLPPEDIVHILQHFLQGRPLTVPQIDKLISFFNQEKGRAEPVEPTPQVQPSLLPPNPNQPPPMSQPTKGTSLQEAELQNRILNILNKGGSNAPSNPPPLIGNAPPTVPGQKPPLLNDPSVQKAIDNLIQGDIFKAMPNPRDYPRRF